MAASPDESPLPTACVESIGGVDVVFCASHSLGSDSLVSVLPDDHGDYMKSKNQISQNCIIHVPSNSVRADWYASDWLGFYNYPFEIGLQIPLPKLVRNFLTFVGVAPIQVMPLIWRILISACKIAEEHGLDLGIEEVSMVYRIKTQTHNRVTFVLRDRAKHLVGGVSQVNDRKWASEYFFVNRDSLGSDKQFIRDRWKKKVKGWEELEPREKSPDILKQFYALHSDIRHFILFPRARRDPIDDLNDHVNPFDQPVDEPSHSAKMSTGSALTPSSRFDLNLDQIIASKGNQAPAEKDTVRTRARVAAAGSIGGSAGGSVVSKIISADRPPTGKKRKAPAMVELPHDIDPFKANPIVLAPHLDPLFLTSSEEHFKDDNLSAAVTDGISSSFQAFQTFQFLRRCVATFDADLKRATDEGSKLRKEVEKLKASAKLFDVEKSKWAADRSELEASKAKLEEALGVLQADLDERIAKDPEVALFYGLKGRIEALRRVKDDPSFLDFLDDQLALMRKHFPHFEAESTLDDASSSLNKVDAEMMDVVEKDHGEDDKAESDQHQDAEHKDDDVVA